jgi:putative hydrolase of the HAD superfamily
MERTHETEPAVIEIVFFDAGETILHPHPSFAELFASTCHRHGIEIKADDVKLAQERLAPHLLEIGDESGIENPSLSAEASYRFWTYLYRRLLQELNLDEKLAGELYRVFSDSRSYKLFDDVKPAFEKLEELELRLGLISNFEGWLEKLLVELEIGHVFDVSVISGVEGVEKPDPRIYELALQKAGVDPQVSVHVGDSVRFDIDPARSAGMKVVLLDRVGRYEGATACPTISSLEELPMLISNF